MEYKNETVTISRKDLQFVIGLLNQVCDGKTLSQEDRDKLDTITDTELNRKIHDVMIGLGCRQCLLGYEYLKTAIKLSYDDSEMLQNVTKMLYPSIAKAHGTTSSRAERAIRHTIEAGFDNCAGQKLKEDIFGNSTDGNKGKPTNTHFIAAIVEYLRDR